MFNKSDGKDRSLNKGNSEKIRQTLNSFFLPYGQTWNPLHRRILHFYTRNKN